MISATFHCLISICFTDEEEEDNFVPEPVKKKGENRCSRPGTFIVSFNCNCFIIFFW